MFDALTTTRMTLENLAGEFDPDALSGDDAVRAVTVLGVIHRLTEGLLAKAARRVADTSAHVPGGNCDAAQFYARVVGVGAGEAHRVLGMAKRLEPEVGGPCKAALDAEVQRIFRARRSSGEHESHEAYAADAFASFIFESGDATAKRGARRAATNVHVVIDHAALVRGNATAGERCEIPGVGPVNARWVREQLGHAFLTAVIKKGRDIRTVAHLGRHVPAVVRTAMLVGGRECEVAGCARRGYLERDHCVIDFAKGGPTARWNLAWLCWSTTGERRRDGGSARRIRRPASAPSDHQWPAPRPLPRDRPG